MGDGTSDTMADLLPDQLGAVRTVGHARDLMRMPTLTGRQEVENSLLSVLGVQPDTLIGALGIIGESEFENAVSAWKIPIDHTNEAEGTREPTLGERGAALYLGSIARRKVTGQAATMTPPAALPSVPVVTSTSVRRVKLSQVLSQLDDTEVDLVSETEMFSRYEVLYGKGQRPHQDHEPSIEQLSALKALADSGQCPYADFAIFQPHAARIMKRIKFSGLIMGKSGALMHAELYGPPDIESWRASYEVWSTAMVMLDLIDLGPLQAYRSRLELLHTRYGDSKVWPLLYQADTESTP